jgi:hypothetical protein
MSGMNVLSSRPISEVMVIARETATDLGFQITDDSACAFRAGKSNLPLSILVGAFVAYCDFRVTCTANPGGSKVFIERNKPWWTGIIGLSRVAKQAKLLAEAIRDAAQDLDGTAVVEEVK